MHSPYLVAQVQHAHLRVLHLEHTVLQQELAAQVVQVGCPHGVHGLADGAGKELVSATLLLLTAPPLPRSVPAGPACLEGLEVLQGLLLIQEGVQRPHQQDDGEQAP